MMNEQPNLEYITQLAQNSPEYKERILNIIKAEFPQEKIQFFDAYQAKDYTLAAEMTHKLKHKINIFGLAQGYEIARDFENQLKEKETTLYPKFCLILEQITTYLLDIWIV